MFEWALGLLGLLVLSAYFTLTESAMLCAPGPWDPRPDALPEGTSPVSRERLMAAILIGNTLANVSCALAVTAWVHVAEYPAWWPVAGVVVALVVAAGCEFLPRQLGRRRATGWLRRTRVPTSFLVRVLSPAAHALNRASRVLLLAFGFDPRDLHPKVGSGDLRFLLRTGSSGGAVLPEQQLMLRSASSLSGRTVREVMVPLTEVRGLRRTARVRDALELAQTTSFTRFPVHGDRIDDIQGIVNVYDILYSEFDPDEPLKRFLRPGLYVPNTVAIDKLLFQMQRRRMPLAIVVDEFGAADGLVTVSDVVEEVIGAFASKDADASRPIQRLAGGVFLIDGHASLDTIQQELQLELPKKNYDTLAGFLMTEMERIPDEGEEFVFGDLCFTMIRVRRHTIQRVQLRRKT